MSSVLVLLSVYLPVSAKKMMKMTKKTNHAYRSYMRIALRPMNEMSVATTARITMPTIREIWPSATAVSARPPVIQATAAQPIWTIVLSAAMTLFGHHPNAYRDTEIWRSPVGAPKVAAKPVGAAPRREAKMVMTMDWRSAAAKEGRN